MTSFEIKMSLIYYFMIQRNYPACVTEYNLGGYLYIADIVAIDKKMLSHEVEIKVTKADLLSELKAIKSIMDGNDPDGSKYRKHYNYLKGFKIPNKFSFAVPDELVEFTLNEIQNTPYGLIKIGNNKHSNYKTVKILKRAKKLKDKPITDNQFKLIAARACRYNFTLMNNMMQANYSQNL